MLQRHLVTGLLLLATTMRAADTPLPEGLYAEITTPRGAVIAELYFQKTPMTCASFVGLAEGTLGPAPRKPFYDGLTFHRVVEDLVVQGGDPTGTGYGNAGYLFPDEIVPGLHHDAEGVLQMTNNGPDTNGSQFAILLAAAPHLNYGHTIFGRVVRGLSTLSNIRPGDTMRVTILRIGAAARQFRADEKSFAELVARAPRLPVPFFEDLDAVMTLDRPWRGKFLEGKLANFHRFAGGKIYVRLVDQFAPEFAGQTIQQYVDGFRTQLHLPPEAVLACYFAQTDEWRLAAGGPAGVKLPYHQTRKESQPSPTNFEARRTERVRIYTAAMEVINGLITQLEPK